MAETTTLAAIEAKISDATDYAEASHWLQARKELLTQDEHRSQARLRRWLIYITAVATALAVIVVLAIWIYKKSLC